MRAVMIEISLSVMAFEVGLVVGRARLVSPLRRRRLLTRRTANRGDAR